MKDTFFTLLALSIPLVIFGGLLYMFGQGLVTLARDWLERRQMDQLRQRNGGSSSTAPAGRGTGSEGRRKKLSPRTIRRFHPPICSRRMAEWCPRSADSLRRAGYQW